VNKHDFNLLTQSARSASLADYFLCSNYTTKKHGAGIYVKEFVCADLLYQSAAVIETTVNGGVEICCD
jgi:hypothetical protein